MSLQCEHMPAGNSHSCSTLKQLYYRWHDKSQQHECMAAGKIHSCSPLKRLKPSEDAEAPQAEPAGPSAAANADSDDAELARKLHEQLNGPDSPTAAPMARHITRVRKAPTFYKPEVPISCMPHMSCTAMLLRAGLADISLASYPAV